MTKKLTSLILGFVLLGTTITKAQLSGVYSVGGTLPAYPTVLDAVADLVAQGVSGPVVFNIRDGVYTGKIILPEIAGASSTNSILFQSENADSSLVTITSPSVSSGAANYTLFFNGADYITFKQLTIERSGIAVSARVIDFADSADYNTITNCIVTNGATTATGNFNVIIYSAPGTKNNFNTFSNNAIINGSYGFYFYGASTITVENGNMITNNTFTNQTVAAIQTANEADLIVNGNVINGATSAFKNAILITNCNNNTMVMGNKIYLTDGGAGISVQQCNGLTGEVVVANNFVTVNTLFNSNTTEAMGIKLNSCTKTGIYYNSVWNRADYLAAFCYAFQAVGSGNNVSVYNNIFDAAFSYVVGVASAAVAQMNYNDLYSYGFFFGQYNGTTNFADLAAWQSGTSYDTNSVSVDPLFVSPTDLHIQTFALNAIGTPVANVTTDIDGQVRDVTTPDIGADETNPPSNDVGIFKLLSPTDGACGDLNQTVIAIVKNYAALPQSNITVTAEITGTQTLTLTGTIVGPIPVYGVDTVYLTPTINTSIGDSLTIKLFTSILNDEDNSNDTLTIDSIYINPIPAPPGLPATASTCINSPVSITATLQTSQEVYWFANPSGGSTIQVGNPLTVAPVVQTTYYAEARDTTTSGANTEDSLTTFNTGGNGSSCNYFDITNISGKSVTLHYFSMLMTGTQTATIYYMPNALASCTASPSIATFTTIGSVLVTGLGGAGSAFTYIPLDINITIPSGATYAFCLSGTGSNTYTDGTNTGTCPVIASDAVIQIHEGFGGTISGPIANRRFNGRVAYSTGGACPSDRVAVTVDVLPLPTVFLGNDTTIALPDSLTLDAGAGFTSYLWSTGATTQTIVVNVSSAYSVTVTDSNGCQGVDAISVAVLTSINDFGAGSSFSIVPNPATEFIKVALTNFANDKYTISLINNLGQLVISSTINVQSASAEQTLDLANIQPGVYFVEIKGAKGISRNRIVVQ